jgi:hypothetical protein
MFLSAQTNATVRGVTVLVDIEDQLDVYRYIGGALKDVSQPVLMTGPATSVFEGEIDVPELP